MVESDRWSRWLLERRDAGDERQRGVALTHLIDIRDRLLSHAGPLEAATVLDVGTGDGLIGLGALELVGPRGQVIFSDISAALLDECRQAVESRGELDRAQFVLASAEELTAIADGSVDVITTRSVLIYVAEKARAFSEFHRALRPGGGIALFEPINRLMFPEPEGRFWGYDVSSVTELAASVTAVFTGEFEDAARDAMMDFDDRDLARLCERAGFERVHVECHIDVEPGGLNRSASIDALLDGSPNPNAPTLREAVTAALTSREQQRFLTALEQAVLTANAIRRSAVAYVAARKSDPVPH